MATVSKEVEEAKTKYEHTEKIGERRKALFPTDDADSDLGHMSPIHSEASNFSDGAPSTLEHDADRRFRKFFKCNIDDYVLLDNDSELHQIQDTFSEASLPPLYLSPLQSLISTPMLYSPMHVNKVTPLGKSPSSTLKTPHDTSTIKVNLKQTKRKLLVENTDGINIENSPNSKQAKLDLKSKVRTALFPDSDIVLPVKSFYPKEIQKFDPRQRIAALFANTNHKSFVYPTRPLRKNKQQLSKKTRRFGEINAGVRHKIKKPKLKKETKTKLVKATMSIIEKSPLTDYLEEITKVSKTIKPLPAAVNPIQAENNKENDASDDEGKHNVSNRKFFKTLRSTIKKVYSKTDLDTAKEVTPSIKRKLEEFSLEESEKAVTSPVLTNIIDKLTKETEKVPKQSAEILFSPTSQMCDMASALDLNSPKRAKLNITKMLADGTCLRTSRLGSSSAEKLESSAKLFPLFYGDGKKVNSMPTGKRDTAQNKKFKSASNSQMMIDAGQKKFGAVECQECSFVYEIGNPADESIHKAYHDAINTFKFNGWKHERVVTLIDNETKIIKLIPSDSKVWWKKGNEVMDYINRELGFFDTVLSMEKSQMYLYIKNKKIVGCLTAEMKQTAYKMLPMDLDIDVCSEEAYKVRCGVSRIWVAQNHRRTGVASQMMDSLRRNFLHGYMLSLNEIAMSTPTDAGKQFAKKYFNTDTFLIYMN